MWVPVGAFMGNPSGLPIQRARPDYQLGGWHPSRLAWEVGLRPTGAALSRQRKRLRRSVDGAARRKESGGLTR